MTLVSTAIRRRRQDPIALPFHVMDALERYLTLEHSDEPFEEALRHAKTLIGTDTDLNRVDKGGRGRLYRQVSMLMAGEPTVPVEVLLALGADASVGITPLAAAAFTSDFEFLGNKAAVIDLLVAAGCDVNTVDDAGVHLIERAALPDNNGPGFRSSDGFSCTAVMRFVAHGADSNFRCTDGFTLLHRAAEAGSEDAVDFLLADGADPNARTTAGATPLELAHRHLRRLRRPKRLRWDPVAGHQSVPEDVAARLNWQLAELQGRRIRAAQASVTLLEAAQRSRRR